MSYHLVFPIRGFFGDDILRYCYNDYHGVSLLFSHQVLRSFILIYQGIPKFSHRVSRRIIMAIIMMNVVVTRR